MTASNGNLKVYRSSAGSGKTYTLVKHYLRLALQNDRADYFKHILAITFTNKAASEMKSRVMIALAEISSRTELEGTSKYLFDDLLSDLPLTAVELREKAAAVHSYMLHNYSDLSIMTIDRFMYRVIRSFARELGLQIGFEVSVNSEDLLKETIANLMAKVGEDQELTSFILNFAQGKLDEDRSWKIEDALLRFSQSLLKDSNKKNIEALDEWTPGMFIDLHKKITEKNNELEEKIHAIGREYAELLEDHSLTLNDFSGKERGGAGTLGTKLLAFSFSDSGWKLTPTMIKIYENMEGLYPKSADPGIKETIDSIVPQLADLWSRYKTLSEIMEPYRVAAQIKSELMSLGLLRTIQQLSNEYKEENNQLYISDFNEKIAEIVESEPMPFIYERVGYRFNHFLIDEFQDTSTIQWFNLLPLVEEGLSRASFSMIVGDGKQSIYRWRSGDAEQFERLPEIYFNGEDHTLKYNLQNHYKAERLENNFRSEPSIIQFNNELFEKLKGEAPYMTETYAGHEQQTSRDKDQGYVRLEFVEEDKADEFRAEAVNRMVETIDRLRAEKVPLKSMAILVRTRKEVPLISRKLGEKNISFISAESLRIDQSVQVKLLIAALRYLARPEERINKAELIWRLYENEQLEGEVHSYLSKVDELGIDSYPFSRIDLESIGKKTSLFEVVESLLRTFGLDEAYTGFLNVFMEEVFAFQKQRSSDLLSFLSHWDLKKENLSISIPEGQEAVQILTIHKSKGLEFDCVFVPGIIDTGNRLSEEYSWLDEEEHDCDIPSALVKLRSTGAKAVTDKYEVESDRVKLDAINLIYVAFTRASKRLYAWVNKTKPKKNGELPKTFDGLLLNVAQTMEGWSEEKSILFKGSEVQCFDTKKKGQDVHLLGSVHSVPWEEKLSIAPLSRAFGEKGRAIDEGVKLHAILEGVAIDLKTEDIVNQGVLTGRIKNEEAARYKELLEKVFEHSDVQALLAMEGEVMVERDLIDADGNTYRPDRMILNGSQATVIDYKSGQQRPFHINQVQEYMALLQDCGYTRVDGYLLYLDPVSVVRV